jgi:hypothetical protein
MENQKYSGEVNLDHPVIDDRDDGIYLYFTPLPPILLHNPIRFPPPDDDFI